MDRVKTYSALALLILLAYILFPKSSKLVVGCDSKPVITNCSCAGLPLNGNYNTLCIGITHSCKVQEFSKVSPGQVIVNPCVLGF
jgi:hypothetical protein